MFKLYGGCLLTAEVSNVDSSFIETVHRPNMIKLIVGMSLLFIFKSKRCFFFFKSPSGRLLIKCKIWG